MESDENSCWWGANLHDSPANWYSGHGKPADHQEKPSEPPLRDDAGQIPADARKSPFQPSVKDIQGKVPVLTVAKLGDWYGPNRELTYSVMIIDAARDLMLNAFWQKNAELSDDARGL